MTDAQIDPRIVLATIILGSAVSLTQKVIALVHQNKDDDAELAAIIAEADARIARRG